MFNFFNAYAASQTLCWMSYLSDKMKENKNDASMFFLTILKPPINYL